MFHSEQAYSVSGYLEEVCKLRTVDIVSRLLSGRSMDTVHLVSEVSRGKTNGRVKCDLQCVKHLERPSVEGTSASLPELKHELSADEMCKMHIKIMYTNKYVIYICAS